MRLFLLPISARRTLIYCDKQKATKRLAAATQSISKSQEKPNERPPEQSYLDRITAKAASTWTGWERAEGGWQKTLTVYGNALLRRIPYEEWGLKSFPPLHGSLLEAYKSGKRPLPIDVLFPGSFLPKAMVPSVLQTLATERQELHRRRMWGSAIGAPLTLPFALVPV
jgi:hypothetical protein